MRRAVRRTIRALFGVWACWGIGSALVGAVTGAFAPLPTSEPEVSS